MPAGEAGFAAGGCAGARAGRAASEANRSAAGRVSVFISWSEFIKDVFLNFHQRFRRDPGNGEAAGVAQVDLLRLKRAAVPVEEQAKVVRPPALQDGAHEGQPAFCLLAAPFADGVPLALRLLARDLALGHPAGDLRLAPAFAPQPLLVLLAGMMRIA